MTGRPFILTDLDNTIYNWVDFFAPSFRAMVHVLARETSTDEETIIEQFKRVYGEKKSLEYAFSVQELEIVRNKPSDEIERLARIAKGAFSRVREANLMKPYDGVKETLQWASRKGIAVVGVTNAPIDHAETRLKHLYLDHLFSGLAGWEGHDIPRGYALTEEIRRKAEQGKYRSKVPKLWLLQESELKPSASGYRRIMKDLGASREATYVIGDSLQKDLRPAAELGLTTVWARYGLKFDAKNFDTLLTITHWSNERVAAVYQESSIQPTFTLESFSEIQQLVSLSQGRLF